MKRRSSVKLAGRITSQPAGEIDNSQIAEWLALEAESATGHWQRALRRASRAAFLWPIEAADLLNEGRSLTELPAIGPATERLVQGWFSKPPTKSQKPPIRSNFLTLAQARRILAQEPDWAARYQGDLQMHSTWSDGAGSIAAMANAAAERGYHYIAITDHSKGLKIAGGIDEHELRRQSQEILTLNHRAKQGADGVRVLRSIELNLNPAGEGDMDPSELAELDLVLGSFHSALRTTEDQTSRYLAAVRNPSVQILGHPRGRIYNHRLGLKADWPRVFAEAARLDKAVEVDSYPDRQDLDIELLVLARKAGVRVAIDTDAHAPEQLGFAEFGLAAVLLAEIPAERVLNFMPVTELLAWSESLRLATADR